MARLWSGGAELNSVTDGVEQTLHVNSPTIVSTDIRSGTYVQQTTSLASGTRRGIGYQFASAAADGPYFFRFYFKYKTLPSGNNIICTLNSQEVPSSGRVGIRLTSAGALRLVDEDGVVGSNSSNLSSNTWYRIEIEYNRTGAAGAHVLKARIDGNEFVSSTTRSLSSGVHTLWLGGNLEVEAQTQGEWYFDDIAINDSTGSFQNSYPGEGEIIHLRPNAEGDTTDWDSDTAGPNSHQDVDEVTPDDITSTIWEWNTANSVHEFNLDATPAALASDDTINCVQVGVRYRGAAASGNADFVLRIKASSGGTVEESATIAPANTTWVTNANSTPRNYPLTLYDLPGASTTAWTKTDLDAAQIGVRMAATDVSSCDVSTLWLLVDHKPTAAAATGGNNWPIMTGKRFWGWRY